MAQTLDIRPTTRADLAEIDALFGRSYPALLKGSYPPSIMVTAIPLIARAQPKLVTSGTYFAVRDADGIVGAGGWTPAAPGRYADGGATVGHIRHVVTDHRKVRQGIGRALMDQITANASAQGVTRLNCLSTLMAVPFYATCGFERVQETLVNLAPGVDFPAVSMRRTL